mmetsp:Transcript_60411/g.189902  ORF Transcript_60411/g.189902 Transcript_60411/m.189902 type:complete len:251 (-) Transcript_60411:802-1554(-)
MQPLAPPAAGQPRGTPPDPAAAAGGGPRPGGEVQQEVEGLHVGGVPAGRCRPRADASPGQLPAHHQRCRGCFGGAGGCRGQPGACRAGPPSAAEVPGEAAAAGTLAKGALADATVLPALHAAARCFRGVHGRPRTRLRRCTPRPRRSGRQRHCPFQRPAQRVSCSCRGGFSVDAYDCATRGRPRRTANAGAAPPGTQAPHCFKQAASRRFRDHPHSSGGGSFAFAAQDNWTRGFPAPPKPRDRLCGRSCR